MGWRCDATTRQRQLHGPTYYPGHQCGRGNRATPHIQTLLPESQAITIAMAMRHATTDCRYRCQSDTVLVDGVILAGEYHCSGRWTHPDLVGCRRSGRWEGVSLSTHSSSFPFWPLRWTPHACTECSAWRPASTDVVELAPGRVVLLAHYARRAHAARHGRNLYYQPRWRHAVHPWLRKLTTATARAHRTPRPHPA